MKRFIALLSVGILLLSGCQATPERKVVEQKDLAQMLDTATKDNETDTDNADIGNAETDNGLAEQYGIPTEYKWEAQGADGKLNISVNAPVIIPKGGKMPIYRVMAADFSQEQVTAFWNELIGDTEMWKAQQQITKAQVQEQILRLKSMWDEYGEDAAREELKWLEDAYRNAPEKAVEERADGMLEENTDADGAVYKSIEACENAGGINRSGKYFSVNNNSNRINGTTEYKVSRQANLSYTNESIQYSGMYDLHSAMPVTEDTILEKSIMDKTGLSPKDAIEQVQSMLDRTGCGMEVHRVWLLINETALDDVSGIALNPAEQYSYEIECVRTVDGVPASYSNEYSGGTGDAATSIWGYENMNCTVNKNGIAQVNWNAPLAIKETVNEDAQLKPFAQVKEIFEKMMLVKYEAAAESSLADNYSIDRVELSLHRIAEQNSYEYGLLVPVWNFYGTATHEYEEGSAVTTVSRSLMSINAIDGSVIDIQKGY